MAVKARASARPQAERVTSLLTRAELPLSFGQRVTSLLVQRSNQETPRKQSLPRRTCTKILRGDESSVYDSSAAGGNAIRFACRSLVASEAKSRPTRSGRVVRGTFIPSRIPCADPPGDALLYRAFSWLLLFARAKRSNPLAEGQRKLWLSKVTRSPDASGKPQDARQEKNEIKITACHPHPPRCARRPLPPAGQAGSPQAERMRVARQRTKPCVVT